MKYSPSPIIVGAAHPELSQSNTHEDLVVHMFQKPYPYYYKGKGPVDER